jgi:hypothetical protein
MIMRMIEVMLALPPIMIREIARISPGAIS